jgi:stalled ribosome alternative rescue factor ArfA
MVKTASGQEAHVKAPLYVPRPESERKGKGKRRNVVKQMLRENI